MRHLWRLLAIVGVFALLAAACGDDDDTGADDTETSTSVPGDDGADEPAADDAAPGTTDEGDGDEGADEDGEAAPAEGDICTEDKVGGELRIAPRGATTTLDQYTNGGSNILTSWEGIATHSALMYFDSAAGEYFPLVAESLTPNADSSVWTLALRPEAVFGNGDPLNAQAVIAHLDRHLAPDSTSRLRTDAATQIASYAALDDWTVEFTLNASFGSFPGLLTVGLGQVDNVALIEEVGADVYALDATGGGVGPYELTEWAPAERSVLTAKQDWWGGPVCIETIVVTNIPDMRAAYDAYKLDEIDVLSFNRDPVLLNEAIDDGLGIPVGQVNNSAFMVMPNVGANGYDGPLTDLRVRQAIAYAIDPEVVNERAWGGEGIANKGFVSDESTLLNGTEGLPYDPDKATELLDEVKAELGWDGSLDAIAAGNPSTNKEATIAVAAMLDAVGFKINLQAELPVTELVTKVIFEKSFELVASWGITTSEVTLPRGLRAWTSTNPGNQNGFADPAYDAAVAATEAAESVEDYQAALEALQLVLNDTLPFITYGADPTTTIYRDTVHGLVWHDGITPFVDRAYLTQ